MRQYFLWAFPVVALVVASSGCSATQKQSGLFGALSARGTTPARSSSGPTTPAQLASAQPSAVQPPSGGYEAQLASTSRSAPSKRFQVPKCLSSG